MPSALKDLGDAQQPTPRGNSGSALPRGKSSGGLLAKASQRLRGNLGREGSSPQLLEPSGHSGSSSAGSEQSSVQQDREQLPPGAPAGGNGSFSGEALSRLLV